jgi:hypothetical protein
MAGIPGSTSRVKFIAIGPAPPALLALAATAAAARQRHLLLLSPVPVRPGRPTRYDDSGRW